MTQTTAAPSLPGKQTLIECWRAIAAGSPGASVVRTHRSVSAVSPSFAAMNNAIALGGAVAAEALSPFIERGRCWVATAPYGVRTGEHHADVCR